MRRFKSLPAILLSLFLSLLAVAESARAHGLEPAAPVRGGIDRVALKHPGYTIAVTKDGCITVDFLLNQKGISRQAIGSSYVFYPRERFRQASVERGRTEILFALVRSPQFAAVGPEYLASPGTFAHAGHRVIMSLDLSAGSTLARGVTFDSSRKGDWPAPLRRAVNEITRLGQATGPLPIGPAID